MNTSWEPSEWAKHVNRSVGSNIARYRADAGLTGQQLSDRCSELGFPVSKMMISRIERGAKETISLPEIFTLGAALGVPPLMLCINVNETFWLTPNQERWGFKALSILGGGYTNHVGNEPSSDLPNKSSFSVLSDYTNASLLEGKFESMMTAKDAIDYLVKEFKSIDNAIRFVKVQSGGSIATIHRKGGILGSTFSKLLDIEFHLNFEIKSSSIREQTIKDSFEGDNPMMQAYEAISDQVVALMADYGIDPDVWLRGVEHLILASEDA